MGALKKLRRRLKLNRGALASWLPFHLQQVLRYQSCHGEFCLLFRPKTFNQKQFYKQIYDRRPLLVTFADKLLVREYVREKVGGEILINLLAVAARPEAINFDGLPRQFVLKANHGSGYVRIVKDRLTENEAALRRICDGWLSENYGEKTREWVYKNIPPKIMVEEFLDDGSGTEPKDYKFYVFNGKVFMIQVDTNRFMDHRLDMFSTDWRRFEAGYHYPRSSAPPPPPAALPEMIRIAERLADGIDFIRVDLYAVAGRIYFGEMTNFPGNGSANFTPREFDAMLGAQWRIEGY